MANKKPFVANKNHFFIFVGIFLCLFTLILCLNTGIVARVLSTPFTYALGSVSYLLYIAIICIGLRFIFVRKFFKIRFNVYFFGTILILIAGIMLYTHFVSLDYLKNEGTYLALSTNAELKSSNYLIKYNELFDEVKRVSGKDYYWVDTFSPVTYPFAGGIAGYFLVGLFNNLFNVAFGGMIVAIIFAVLGLTLFILPTVLRSIGKEKEAKQQPVQVEEKNETISDISTAKKTPQKVRNIDVIKSASEIDPDNYESEIMGLPKRSAAISSPTFIQQDSGANNFTISDNGSFVPAKFVTDNGQHRQQEQIQEQPVQPQPVDNKVNEQLHLDFDAAPELNQELIQAKPVFEEPKVAVAPNVQPQPQVANNPQVMPQNQPVQEKPKPKERVKWIQPSTEVLNTYETTEQQETNRRVADERKELINIAFSDFGVGAHVEDYTIGPSITRFNIKYDHNVSARSVSNMVQDIQIRLSGVSARFESIVEGQSTSGLEIPNANVTTVSFKDVYEALPDVKKHPLAVAFGKNIKGDVIYADFDEFPHALVSGTTGSGKSIFVNSIIVSLIMRNSPDDLKMVLVDPKKVEMSRYRDMPHLLCPIITEAQEAKALMDKLCVEMEDRYKLFAENGCTNIKEFNEDAPGLGLDKLPYIMVFFDEYADMVDQCKEISMPVVSIAQKARACGIHMCIATQRPSTNVVTGVIKANLPTHVALMMASAVDSMTIIGEGGAEKLIGKGDMLVQSPLVSRVGVVRLQGCFIARQEISRVIGYLKEHYETHYDEKFLNLMEEAEQAASEYMNTPEFKEHNSGNSEEDRYQAIKDWVMTQEFMSISRIQRECAVGFNRAGRFFLRLQSEGIVGQETEGNKGCRVMAQDKFGSSNEQSVVTSDEQSSFRSDD